MVLTTHNLEHEYFRKQILVPAANVYHRFDVNCLEILAELGDFFQLPVVQLVETNLSTLEFL